MLFIPSNSANTCTTTSYGGYTLFLVALSHIYCMHIMPLTLCGGAVVVSGAEWWYTHVAVFTTHHCGLHYSVTMVGIYVAMPEMVM